MNGFRSADLHEILLTEGQLDIYEGIFFITINAVNGSVRL